MPSVHDGWMWDLTVPGNNDHDFYVIVSGGLTTGAPDPMVAVLVHNMCPMARSNSVLKTLRLPKSFDGIDFDHIRANHFPGGDGVTPSKDLWPANTTNEQIESITRQAFGNNPKIVGYDAQTGILQAQARVGGTLYQFQIPRGGGTLRSIYPIG